MGLPNLVPTLLLMFLSIRLQDGSKILGGQVYKDKEFPSLVAIISLFGPMCSGTILNKHHVITAAHCVQDILTPHMLNIIAGDVRIDDQANASRQRVSIQKIFIHPNYNRTTVKNDIAILILRTALELNDAHVSAAILTSETPKIGTRAFVAGWGYTEDKTWKDLCLATEVTIFTKDKCAMDFTQQNTNFPREIVAAENVTSDKQTIVTPDKSQICAGDLTDETGSYLGDPGGPLFVRSLHNSLELVGIVSYDDNEDPKVAVYSDIAYYRNWIMDILFSFNYC